MTSFSLLEASLPLEQFLRFCFNKDFRYKMPQKWFLQYGLNNVNDTAFQY